MTYLEAYLKKYPYLTPDDVLSERCPETDDLPKDKDCYKYNSCDAFDYTYCKACWNREIPGTDIPKENAPDAHQPTQAEKEDFWYGTESGTFTLPEAPEPSIVYQGYIPITPKNNLEGPRVLDSGSRREFGTGAVRDSNENKGRCDLLPLDVVAAYVEDDNESVDWVLMHISKFQEYGQEHYLFNALNTFSQKRSWDPHTMLIEASKQYADGAAKYGANNWKMGMPVQVCIDSAVRHYLKWLRGDEDEPHDRAVCWNLLCAIWTCKHKPELNEYHKEVN